MFFVRKNSETSFFKSTLNSRKWSYPAVVQLKMTGMSMWTPIYTLYGGRILRPRKTWIFDLGYTKIAKIFFVSFRFFVLFCVIFGFLLQNFFSTKTSYFSPSFDCISVKISPKLRKLQKNENGPFFSQHGSCQFVNKNEKETKMKK